MWRVRGAAGTGRIVACALALVCSVPPALAQSSPRVPAGAGIERAAPQGPARFFRISDVIKKLDAGKTPGKDEPVRLAAHTSGDTVSDAPLRGSLPAIGEEPFGLFAFRAPEGVLWRKWRAVEADIAAEMRATARCRDEDDCAPGARRFLAILDAVQAHRGRAQLDEVNRQVNGAIRYISDLAQHGEPDRWTAPLASFAAGRGDCEDYAIAKYVILREAGFPLADLRFLLVRDRIARDDHAVLAARLEGRWLILDNRFAAMPDDSQMRHFVPLFALDHEGVKLVAAPYAKRTPLAGESAPAPAALFEGEDLSLRGALKEDNAAPPAATHNHAGDGDWYVAPLLM
jgi:predicted transglutaminase-like cysteine proteinase